MFSTVVLLSFLVLPWPVYVLCGARGASSERGLCVSRGGLPRPSLVGVVKGGLAVPPHS